MRVGWGFDAHGFVEDGVVVLGGVEAASGRGVAATSDGDVVAHAVIDALLGGAARGDIGQRFPSDEERWSGADSMEMLGAVVVELAEAGFTVLSLDVTVVAQTVRVEPIRADVRRALAEILGIDIRAVSVKATTTDGLGFIGRDEGLAAMAVAVLAEG